jgi:hypothetical protein
MKLRRHRRGQSLVVAVLLLTLLLAVATLLTLVSGQNSERVEASRTGLETLGAARSGLAQAKLEVWESYLTHRATVAPGDGERKAGNSEDFRDWLENTSPLALANGATVALPAMAFDRQGLGKATGYMRNLQLTRTVTRHDDGNDTFIYLAATAADPRDPGSERTAETVLRLGGQRFEGFRFALLANNINCIFCHTKINTFERFYGLSGPYERVKVASLETLQSRDKADSTIAGTLYVQGAILKKDGTFIPEDNLGDSSVGGAGGLQAEDMTSTGEIIDPSAVVDFLFEGNNVPFANFYKNYPSDPALQVDGALPDKFPPVVPDENGDRVVDPTEWQATTAAMTGTISGGLVRPVPAGSTYSGDLPVAGDAGTTNSFDPSVNANTNVILVGTKDNPIVLSGEVAVDGDVVISGYVQGEDGVLVTKGNLYVVGDLIYNDTTDANGDRVFGTQADGSKNNLAFAAAGNIIHGPYNTGRDGSEVTDDSPRNFGTTNFNAFEIPLFNRMEWTKTQPYVAADGTVTDVVANAAKDADGNPVANSAYESGHTPRYYTFDPGSTPNMFLNGHTWDNVNKVWHGKEFGGGNVDLSGGVISALDPSNGWITPGDYKAMLEQAEADRTAANNGDKVPYEIDGLLYTDNAIMMMSRRNSSGGGQMIVNGGILASDVGVLVPGSRSPTSLGRSGLHLNYDKRTAHLLNVQDPTTLDLYTVSRRER